MSFEAHLQAVFGEALFALVGGNLLDGLLTEKYALGIAPIAHDTRDNVSQWVVWHSTR